MVSGIELHYRYPQSGHDLPAGNHPACPFHMEIRSLEVFQCKVVKQVKVLDHQIRHDLPGFRISNQYSIIHRRKYTAQQSTGKKFESLNDEPI